MSGQEGERGVSRQGLIMVDQSGKLMREEDGRFRMKENKFKAYAMI
jgi:hypothetical protein